MAKRLFLTATVTIYCYFCIQLIGSMDWGALALALISAWLMKDGVLEFQMGSRHLLADHFRKDSAAQEILNNPGFLTHIFAFIAAFIVTLGFFITLKGMSINHGSIPVIVIISGMTYALYKMLMPTVDRSEEPESSPKAKPDLSERHLGDSAYRYAKFVMGMVLITVILNIALASLLSAKDTMDFVTSESNFDTFDHRAVDRSVAYNGLNPVSRALLNGYILSSEFRTALTNEILDSFIDTSDRASLFYGFWPFYFVLNLVHALPFSLGFVLLLRGLRKRNDAIKLRIERLLGLVAPSVKRALARAQETLASRRSRANTVSNSKEQFRREDSK